MTLRSAPLEREPGTRGTPSARRQPVLNGRKKARFSIELCKRGDHARANPLDGPSPGGPVFLHSSLSFGLGPKYSSRAVKTALARAFIVIPVLECYRYSANYFFALAKPLLTRFRSSISVAQRHTTSRITRKPLRSLGLSIGSNSDKILSNRRQFGLHRTSLVFSRSNANLLFVLSLNILRMGVVSPPSNPNQIPSVLP